MEIQMAISDYQKEKAELGIKHEVTDAPAPEMNRDSREIQFNRSRWPIKHCLSSGEKFPHSFGRSIACFACVESRFVSTKTVTKAPFEKYSEKIIPNPRDFQDLSEQQEALAVEVTIPNCHKQAIRSRDASKWRDR
ncbi:hypothetical protein TNCV_1962591 [Trichonephila clavipes]|nr:hypothetical protein TNCV_1962591 [Trichonephila clavipes]